MFLVNYDFIQFCFLLACECNKKGSKHTVIEKDKKIKKIYSCNDDGECDCQNDRIESGGKCEKCKMVYKQDSFPDCNECANEGTFGHNCEESKFNSC